MITPAHSFAEDFRHYLSLFWRSLWRLLLVTILAAGAVYLVSSRADPIFRATTTVLIIEAPATRTTDYSSIIASERLAKTYAELMTKQTILEGVIQALSLETKPEVLSKQIQAGSVRDTTLIEVSVEDENPRLAARIANELVAEFARQNQALQASRYQASKESLSSQLDQMDVQIQQVLATLSELGDDAESRGKRDRLEENLAQYRQTYAYLLQSFEQVRLAEAQSTANVIQVEMAVPPDEPVRPKIWLNTLLAGMMVFLLALGAIFLFDALDDTVKTPEEVTSITGQPVLGIIIRHGASEANGAVTATDPRSPAAEAFRSLRTNMQFASVDQPLKTVLITSPSPGEGKSTVAINLAVAMAQGEKTALLMDADLRRPRVHDSLNLPNQAGLSDLFLNSNHEPSTVIQETGIPGLQAMTSGNLPPNPAELLGSEKMQAILAELEVQFDVLVIDSPPIMAVTDSSVLAPFVDGVLLVIKPYFTHREAARQSVEQLKRSGARLLGIVLNEVELRGVGYSRYRYPAYYYSIEKYFDRTDKKKPFWRR